MISSAEKKNRIRRLNLFRLGFFLLIFSLLLTALTAIRGLFVTMLLAFVIHFALLPLVNLLRRWGCPRSLAVPVVFFGVFGGLLRLLFKAFPFFSQQMENLKTEFPVYIQKTSGMIRGWQERFETNFFALEDLDMSTGLEGLLSSLGTAFFQDLPSTLTQSFTVLLLAPFFAYFMIKNELGFTRYLYPLVPNNVFEMFVSLHYKISRQIGVFIRGRLIEASFVGAIVGIGFTLLDFPFALLLGVLSSLTNLVPYIGPLVGSIPVFLVALVNDYEMNQLLLIMGVYFGAQVIDSMILIPLILARIVNLHPLTVIVIILAGAQFMGVLGMLISIPLANALKVSVMAVYQHITDNI